MFTIKIKIHGTLNYSSFFFLYDKHLILSFDANSTKFIEVTNLRKEYEARIIKLQYVKLTANKKFLIRVIYANKIRDTRFNLYISTKIKH